VQAHKSDQRGVRDRDLRREQFDDYLVMVFRDLATSAGIDGWIGTESELMAALSARAPENVCNSQFWPATAQATDDLLNRIVPLVSGKHLFFRRENVDERAMIILRSEYTAEERARAGAWACRPMPGSYSPSAYPGAVPFPLRIVPAGALKMPLTAAAHWIAAKGGGTGI
jgi:hypothetical protein